MHSYCFAGISLVDETTTEVEAPSEQEKQLSEGIQFAYTVPSNDTSQTQEVRFSANLVCTGKCVYSPHLHGTTCPDPNPDPYHVPNAINPDPDLE